MTTFALGHGCIEVWEGDMMIAMIKPDSYGGIRILSDHSITSIPDDDEDNALALLVKFGVPLP